MSAPAILTTVAFFASGVIGIAIIILGVRSLVAPQAAASGYGVPVSPRGRETPTGSAFPWLYVKGVRDIASGIFIFILLANREPHLLGTFMAAASIIPMAMR